MRATLALLLVAGCNFLTTDLEDEAPVRPLEVPGDVTLFGHALAALPAGSCGASAALVVAGQTVDGPQLYLVTIGSAGGSTRTRINNFQRRGLAASDEIVAMDPIEGTMSLAIALSAETEANPTGKIQILIDSDCDGNEDTACADFCDEGDLPVETVITGAEDQVDLFGSGTKVAVVGDPASGGVRAGADDVLIPEDVEVAGLGRAVAEVPFETVTGDVTFELAVGGDRAAFLFFRTGLDDDCDPRDGAPAAVACD